MKQVFPDPKNDYYRVYINTCTYNQAPYIEDCLRGVAMQQTDFPFVHHVIDDCSTDGEQDVIMSFLEREYDLENAEFYDNDLCTITIAQNKQNPNCTIAAYFLKQNMFGNPQKEELFAPWRKVCPYEAFCEGDDYWTDPNKLQKQFDFLERDESVSVCCHRFRVLEESSGLFRDDWLGDFFEIDGCGFYFGSNENHDSWITQPLTMMFRRDCFDVNLMKLYGSQYRDIHMVYYLLKKGKGYCMPDCMGVYRLNSQGVDSTIMGKERERISIDLYGGLFSKNREDQGLKLYYQKLILGYCNTYVYNQIRQNGMDLHALTDYFYCCGACLKNGCYKDLYKCMKKIIKALLSI